MTALPVPARPGGETASPISVQQRRARSIEAFEPTAQKRIVRLASGTPALEDLAETFPALLYALATGYGTDAARMTTIGLVTQGGPLRLAATTLGLPRWLRRIPAAALDGSLSGLPVDGEQSRILASFLPSDPVAARFWLNAVGFACRAAGPTFGTWLGGALNRSPGTLIAHGDDNLRMLAAWAWASAHPETPLGRLLRRPWTPATGIRRALDELTVWRQRIFLELLLAARVPDLALSAGEVRGLTFVPLRTAQEFIAESITMDNCLDQYGERLAERRSHVVSIRRNGRPVANMEIGRHEEEPGIAAIRQLRGQRNRRANAEIWQAAYAWLATQPLEAASSHAMVDTRARRAAASALWETYLDDRAAHLTGAELRGFMRMIGPGTSGTKRLARQPRRSARSPAQTQAGDAATPRACGRNASIGGGRSAA